MCRLRADGSIPSRSLSTLIPPIFCLSAAARLTAWTRSSKSVPIPRDLASERELGNQGEKDVGELFHTGAAPRSAEIRHHSGAGWTASGDYQSPEPHQRGYGADSHRTEECSVSSSIRSFWNLMAFSWSFSPRRWKPLPRRRWTRKVGARGLRSVMEGVMTEIMYEIPSDLAIQTVTVTEDAVKNHGRSGDYSGCRSSESACPQGGHAGEDQLSRNRNCTWGWRGPGGLCRSLCATMHSF